MPTSSVLGKREQADYEHAADRPSSTRTSKMIVYQQNFEWDPRDAATNLTTHGVSFKEAATVFDAEGVAITEDIDSDQLHARGRSSRGRTLIVVHQRGPRIRIVGAMVLQGEAKNADEVEGVTERDMEDETTGIVQAEAVDATTEPQAAVTATKVDDDDVVEAEPAEVAEDAGTTATASSTAAEPVENVVEAPAQKDIEELEPIAQETGAELAATKHGETAGGLEIEETKAEESRGPEAAALPAVEGRHTNEAARGDAIAEPVENVVEAKEAPAPETPARPRRRIVPFRPRTVDPPPVVPESASVTKAANKPDAALAEAKRIPAPDAALSARRRGRPRHVPRENADAPLPAIAGRNQVVKAVAEPAPEPEVTPTPERVTEPPRRRGRPQAEAAKSTAQLVFELDRPDANKNDSAASRAPANSRIPGAGMTAEEYGVYWDAYVAARDEAKVQGHSLREAQRIGREAGNKAVALGAAAPEPAKAPKPAVKAAEPVAAKTPKPVAPKPAETTKPAKTTKTAAEAPKPAQKPTAATAPKPAVPAPRPAQKRAPISWRAAARAVK